MHICFDICCNVHLPKQRQNFVFQTLKIDPDQTVQVISGWDWHITLHRVKLLKNKWVGDTCLTFTLSFHLMLCTELSPPQQHHSPIPGSYTILDREISGLAYQMSHKRMQMLIHESPLL